MVDDSFMDECGEEINNCVIWTNSWWFQKSKVNVVYEKDGICYKSNNYASFDYEIKKQQLIDKGTYFSGWSWKFHFSLLYI